MTAKYSELDVLRKQNNISSVEQGSSMPAWLRHKVKNAAKKLGLDTRGYRTAASCSILLQKLLLHLDRLEEQTSEKMQRQPRCRYRSLFDHPGSTKIDDADSVCFVLEPYPSNEKTRYETELDFATFILSDLLECAVTWTANSWHYPGSTYRVLFEETF